MRLAVTILAIALGVLVLMGVFFMGRDGSAGPGAPGVPGVPGAVQTQNDQAEAPADEAQQPAAPGQRPTDEASLEQGATPEPTPEPVAQDGVAPDAEPGEPRAPAVAAAPLDALRIRAAEPSAPVHLGQADPASPYRFRVDLVQWGAGIRHVALSQYDSRPAIDDQHDPYVLVKPLTAQQYVTYPYAARAIVVNGQRFDLQVHESRTQQPIWELIDQQPASATYRMMLVDGADRPVLEVLRTYRVQPDRYDIQLEQRLINRSGQPLRVRWEQNIQGDLPLETESYMGDRRMFATGYFSDRKVRIFVEDGFIWRSTILSSPQVWPNPEVDPGHDLAWLAAENRYFAVVTYPQLVDPSVSTAALPPLTNLFPDVGVELLPSSAAAAANPAQSAAVLTLGSATHELAPAHGIDLNLGIFAGPRKSEVLSSDPGKPYAPLHLDQLIRYTLGGPCAICTFQPLARFLLWFLTVFAAVSMDWGVAIIVLVLVVRLLLHPLTKRSQVNMMKLSKQMQALQPEIEKLRKKYKDDQKQLNQEMMQLYREKGVNPLNMLGCLPMFLQMPIWIALYAMLYYAIELRHEPAFYGIFPAIGNLFGFNWRFLADLSSADNFIRFVPLGEPGIHLTWIPFINPSFAGINLLPLLMGVVFFFQQKLTMPPAASEQQQSQQRVMRIMVLLFPFMLYSAPSGLTLYILASTCGGIIDSYIVRKHVRQHEEAGTLFDKTPRKPGGIMDRISKVMEEKQKQLQQNQPNPQQPKPGQRGGKGKRRK